jgi:GDPmannose 4,6-dehydratase
VAAIELGLQDRLYLGNLDALRDWGHARDYAEGMWRIVQHATADDWVLATGEAHSVRSFVELAFAEVGRTIAWQGRGTDETGIDQATGKTLVAIDPRYFRPLEVHHLQGDAAKARAELGWQPKTRFKDLVKDMVQADLATLCRERASGRVIYEAAE